jgi:hypothetical protein
MSWARYIRFRDEEGIERQGEPEIDLADDLLQLLEKDSLFAYELIGENPFQAKKSGNSFRVKELLSPLDPEDVPIVRCVGLNYAAHSTFVAFIYKFKSVSCS